MAFIRTRKTRTGVISTALVESYRRDGKSRHRIIANLHGAESLTVALGRLAAKRDRFREERQRLEPSIKDATKFYEVFTTATMDGRAWTAEERVEIGRLLRQRKRLLKRGAEIDKQLDRIQCEGVAIKKHSTASADEIRAEAVKHAKYLYDRECFELGMMMSRNPDLIEKVLKGQA